MAKQKVGNHSPAASSTRTRTHSNARCRTRPAKNSNLVAAQNFTKYPGLIANLALYCLHRVREDQLFLLGDEQTLLRQFKDYSLSTKSILCVTSKRA